MFSVCALYDAERGHAMTLVQRNIESAAARSRTWLINAAVCFALVLITLAVFAQVSQFEFLNFDDNIMISENPNLAAGLSWRGIAWAFTANLTYHDRSVEYWQPITALSRLADVQFFGLDAGRHHLTSVFVHIAAGLVLFGAMEALLQSTVRSALIAALFLIHPLHVEPVAWLAARKDLLNGLFYFATIWAYARYAARANWQRYIAVCFAFLCANMAKPMAVSLPLVLLLLDYWPLRRAAFPMERGPLLRLVLEKLPLFGIAVAVATVTIVVQQQHGAMGDAGMYPLGVKIGNAAVSYCSYLRQAFVPAGLAIFYPHPGRAINTFLALWSAAACVAITTVCVVQAKRRPSLLVGWMWFVVVLLPVSGLVQIGEMARADRYTYVALVGIFLLVVQQAAELLAAYVRSGWPNSTMKAAVLGTTASLLGLTALLAWKQTATWRNSISVFSHALSVTQVNYLAHANLGSALFAAGRRDEGLQHYQEAVRLHTPALDHHRQVATEAEERGDWNAAVYHYGKILTLVPSAGDIRQRLGAVLYRQGAYAKALVQFNEALRYDRNAVAPRVAIARILIAQSRFAEARAMLDAVLGLDPANAEVQQLLRDASAIEQ